MTEDIKKLLSIALTFELDLNSVKINRHSYKTKIT